MQVSVFLAVDFEGKDRLDRIFIHLDRIQGNGTATVKPQGDTPAFIEFSGQAGIVVLGHLLPVNGKDDVSAPEFRLLRRAVFISVIDNGGYAGLGLIGPK